ncbi:MAG: nickel pincer cofactor biosynthesis protein LarB [Pseudomonadales bacterium]
MNVQKPPVDADLTELLQAVAEGKVTPAQAAVQLQTAATSERTGTALQLGHSTLDLDRAARTGASEVVFGEGKTPEQLADIAQALIANDQPVLITRADAAKFAAVQARLPDAEYHPLAKLIWQQSSGTVQAPQTTSIAVISAGTSDSAVAEEAALTCEFYGQRVERFNDVGVAGIHRLFAHLEAIRAARVVIVIAGMEGALPSVVGGLVDKPVIAVPTSVGYGASFGGLTALLGMLNSCASGVSVVNIDNGFGAGYLATMINRL